MNSPKTRNASEKIIDSEKKPSLKKALLVGSLYRHEVEQLHICVRLASYGTAEAFFATMARHLIADFNEEFPGLFKVGKQLQPLPGLLRVLRAMREGHSTVAEIQRSLHRNPLKDAVVRAALKQLVDLGIARKRTVAEKTGAGRPTDQFTLIGE